MRRSLVIAGALVALAACSSDNNNVTGVGNITPPSNLTYQLLPSGDPSAPEGIELRWDPVSDPNVADYAVFSRASSSDSWALRAQTTSPSFEDLGVPDAQYYVASQASDGSLSDPSNTITVDNTNQLDAPTGLFAIPLDHAVQIGWDANARTSNPSAFSYYRVYSTEYNAGQDVCENDWVLEGTTVSEDFIASGLANGTGRCFDVSAISLDGHESEWPTPVAATPTASATDIALFAAQDSAARSAMAAPASATSLGAIGSSDQPKAALRLDQHTDGSLWLTTRSGAATAAHAGAAYSVIAANGQRATVHIAAVGTNYVIVGREARGAPNTVRLSAKEQRLVGGRSAH